MTHHRLPAIVILAVTGFVLAACGESKPSRYYVLNSIAPSQSTDLAHSKRLGVMRVDLPTYLDRVNVVRRDTVNRLDLAAFDQWAEPLQDNLTRVLAEDLVYLLRDEKYIVQVEPLDKSDLTLRVSILKYEWSSDGTVNLGAIWELYDVARRKLLILRRSYFQRQASGGSVDAMIPVMNALLHDLSGEIADKVREKAK